MVINNIGTLPSLTGAGLGRLSQAKGAAVGPAGMEAFLTSKISELSSGSNPSGTMDADMGVMNDALMLDALMTLSKIEGFKDKPAHNFHMPQALARKRAASAQEYQAQASKAQSPNPGGKAPAMDAKSVEGNLAAMFESGHDPAVIGYDSVGGTSYGMFQLSSKTGTFDRFVNFLTGKAPEWAKILQNAGNADTGSKTGPMVDAWKQIAGQDKDKFSRLQTQFIASTHFEPAMEKLESAGFDRQSLPSVLKEVLFSTAVQHGPSGASSIFNKALKAIGIEKLDDSAVDSLVEKVYDLRKNDFPSSSKRVQEAVAGRLEREKKVALSMLGNSMDALA